MESGRHPSELERFLIFHWKLASVSASHLQSVDTSVKGLNYAEHQPDPEAAQMRL